MAAAFARCLRCGFYGTGGAILLLALNLGVVWSQVSVRPLTGSRGEPLSAFAPELPQAVIAAEDSRYYSHIGIDPISMARAAWVNWQQPGIRQGGSTIVQQLARTLYPSYVGRQDTLARKWRESAVALKLEAFYSKKRLLRAYLNRVYLGPDLAGFDEAAQFYFERTAADLSLARAALLVGMLPAPNRYDPKRYPERARQQRNRVIGRMVEAGMLAPRRARQLKRAPLGLGDRAPAARSPSSAGRIAPATPFAGRRWPPAR